MTETDILVTGTDKFSCPGCGGTMTFSPLKQSLLCSYCGNTVVIEESSDDITEYSLDEAESLASHNWGNDNRVVLCKSCSGKTVIDITNISANCIFCGSTHVVDIDLDEGIKPETMIPFKVHKKQSRELIGKWIKRKFYAPKDLRKKQNLDKLHSLYIPFFTYDSNTSTAYTGRKGTYYYVSRTRTVNGKTKTVRERRTRWRNVSGVYSNYFDDVLVNASSKLDDALIYKMNSFNLNELVTYDSAYLAGHQAERYSITLNEGWIRGKNEVDELINSGIRSQVGGDEFRLSSKSTNYGDILFKHVLLPVWITSYEYKKTLYNVYINGQTGNVVGKYPKSVVKIIMTVIALGLIVFLIYLLTIRQ